MNLIVNVRGAEKLGRFCRAKAGTRCQRGPSLPRSTSSSVCLRLADESLVLTFALHLARLTGILSQVLAGLLALR